MKPVLIHSASPKGMAGFVSLHMVIFGHVAHRCVV